MQSGDSLGPKASDKEEGDQLDAQERENCTGAFDFLQGQQDPQTEGVRPNGAEVFVAFPGVRSTNCYIIVQIVQEIANTMSVLEDPVPSFGKLCEYEGGWA